MPRSGWRSEVVSGAGECRTYGARHPSSVYPALPGWAIFGRSALRALMNLACELIPWIELNRHRTLCHSEPYARYRDIFGNGSLSEFLSTVRNPSW